MFAAVAQRTQAHRLARHVVAGVLTAQPQTHGLHNSGLELQQEDTKQQRNPDCQRWACCAQVIGDYYYRQMDQVDRVRQLTDPRI